MFTQAHLQMASKIMNNPYPERSNAISMNPLYNGVADSKIGNYKDNYIDLTLFFEPFSLLQPFDVSLLLFSGAAF
jgi:hypothetical protein